MIHFLLKRGCHNISNRGTDVRGKAQHDILKTFDDKDIASDEMQIKIKNKEPIIILFKIDGKNKEKSCITILLSFTQSK